MSRVLLLGGFARSLILFRTPLLKALVAAGHEVIAAAPDEDPDVPAAMEAIGVHWCPLNFERNRVQPLRDLVFVRRIRRVIRKYRPDRMICYTIKPNIYGGWAAAAEGVPSAAMVTGLGTVFMKPGLRRRVAVRMLTRACHWHDRVFFQNPEDRDDLVAAGVVAPGDQIVMTAGSGVDLQQFPVQPLPDRPVFLMLARLLKAKGVREYLEAARMVRSRYPEAVIRLAGMEDPGSGGIPISEIRAAVEANDIEFLGYVTDVTAELGQCSVYVLPSWHEGTPRSVLEAMSTGRAVITTDTRGCRETVDHGRNGLLVPVRDSAALAEAMGRMIADPTLRVLMGGEGRRMAEERFDAHHVADVILRTLDL